MNKKVKIIESSIDLCHEMIDAFPRKIDRRLVIPISMFMSFTDLIGDVFFLLKNRKLISARIVFRSSVEILFDLQLIDIDVGYINSFLLKYAKDQKEKFQDYLDPNSVVYEKDENKRIEIQKYLAVFKNGLSDNEDGKYHIMEPKKKFTVLNETDFHKYIYRQLCREVHCNLAEIENRHFREGKNGRLALLYDQNPTEKQFPVSEPLLLTSASGLITMNSILSLKMHYKINALIDEVNDLLKGEKLDHIG